MKLFKIIVKKFFYAILSISLFFSQIAPVFATTVTLTDTTTNTTAYSKGNHTFSFTPSTAIPDNGYFYINIPTQFSFENGLDYTDVDLLVDGVQKTLIDGPSSGSNYGVQFNSSTNPMSVQIGIAPSGGAISGGSTIEVRVGTNATSSFTGNKQIVNPAVNNVYTLNLETYNASSTLLDTGSTTITITGGWSVTDTLTDSTISTATNHVFTFTASSSIPASGVISIGFPTSFSRASGLDYTDVDLLVDSSQQALGSATTTVTSSVSFSSFGSYEYLAINLRSGSGISSGAAVEIRVGTNASLGATGDKQYTNASSATTYRFNVQISDSSQQTIYDEDYPIITLTGSAVPEFSTITSIATLIIAGWYIHRKMNNFNMPTTA